MFGACAKCTQGPAGQIEWAVSVGGGQGGKAVAEEARAARGALKEGLHPGLE